MVAQHKRYDCQPMWAGFVCPFVRPSTPRARPIRWHRQRQWPRQSTERSDRNELNGIGSNRIESDRIGSNAMLDPVGESSPVVVASDSPAASPQYNSCAGAACLPRDSAAERATYMQHLINDAAAVSARWFIVPGGYSSSLARWSRGWREREWRRRRQRRAQGACAESAGDNCACALGAPHIRTACGARERIGNSSRERLLP